MRTAARSAAAAVLISLVAPDETWAQVCLRSQPRPQCSGSIVFEFTGATRLNERSSQLNHNAAFIYWTGGYLHNLSARSALGAAFKLTADSDGHRYGPTLLYRRWLSPSASLEFAPGVFLGGQDNVAPLQFPSATADVALNYAGWLGLAVGVDVLREAGRSAEWQGHAGLRFGTWLAPIATLGLGLLIGATW
jgi:hypothetical protein